MLPRRLFLNKRTCREILRRSACELFQTLKYCPPEMMFKWWSQSQAGSQPIIFMPFGIRNSIFTLVITNWNWN